MNIQCNSYDLLKSIERLQEEVERKLRETVVHFSARMVGIASENTPLGDSDKNEKWYAKRYLSTGLSPIEGLARGGWQANDTSSAVFRQVYGPESTSVAISDAFDNMYTRFQLGDDVYISNKGPYIKSLENNSSDQTAGKGIIEPTMDQIFMTFATDFTGIYNRV